jgi:cysteine desulfurase
MHYLDHAATTPLLPEAMAAIEAEIGLVGNPSSVHAAGRRARRVVEESREAVAAAFGARPSEVVFTSGGTEADNLAVKGLFWSRRAEDPGRVRILTSAVEHPAVLDPVQWLGEHEGAVVDLLPVDHCGRVDPDELRRRLARDPSDVAMVSVMWANSEVGTVQPVAECAAVAHEFGVPFHTDAVQAGGQLPVDFLGSGADAMTLSAHKLGGPVGVGALVIGKSASVTPVLHGGGQEREIRSGTLVAAGVAGFAAAAAVVARERAARADRLSRLRDRLVAGILEQVPDAVYNGDPASDPSRRLPGNAHLSFPGCEGDSLLLLLDAHDIACSTGSACSAGVAEPSHVLLAMGATPQVARSSLRFSFGHDSSDADVDALLAVIRPVVERARSAAAVAEVRVR